MNNMTDEAKEFNLACLNYLEKDYACSDVQSWQLNFNPAHDSNDLDLVIDKMEINIIRDKRFKEWDVSTDYINGIYETFEIRSSNKDRKTAIIKCIQQVLRREV